MPGDIDHVSIRAPDEESTNTQRFVRDRVHDLISTSLRFFIRGIDVIDLDGHDGVLWRRRVSGNDLDARARVRGGEPGHPPLVHSVFGQPEEPEELPRPLTSSVCRLVMASTAFIVQV